MKSIAFRRALRHDKSNNCYVLSIPRPVAELLNTEEVEIIVVGDSVKLQGVRRGTQV